MLDYCNYTILRSVQYLDLREKYFKLLMADGNKRSYIIAQTIVLIAGLYDFLCLRRNECMSY